MNTYPEIMKKRFAPTHGHVVDSSQQKTLQNEDFVQNNAARPPKRYIFNFQKYSFMTK